ncbi:MAG: RHS repeat-associated core domain-containing protein [Candidatus Cryptobacteroides sp.]
MEAVSVGDSLWSYSYDSDGNMVSDGHRGLELSYNFLNLPARVRVKGSSTLVYSYLSDGTMVSVSDSISGKGLRFRGSFIYRVASDGAESLESVSGPEGRVYALSDGGYSDTWFVRDYLGSVRAVVDITDPDVSNLPDVILHRSDYLPSGVAFSPAAYSSASSISGIPQSSLDRWRFNGKPEQVSGLCDTGLLDYGARFYDPYIVRWTTADPMAVNYPGTSPYSFCGGDPVNYIDIHGDSLKIIDSEAIIAIYNGLKEKGSLTLVLNNGVVNPASIPGNSSDWFINDLSEIANNRQMVELRVAHGYQHQDENGNVSTTVFDIAPYDDSPDENDESYVAVEGAYGTVINGNLGRVLVPQKSGTMSMNSNVQIIINAKGALNHRTVGIAHEFGHTLLYLRGLPHKHDEPGVNDFINYRIILMSRRLGYDF